MIPDFAIGAMIGVSGQLSHFAVGFYKARRNGQPFKFDPWLFGVGLLLGAQCGVLAFWKYGVGQEFWPVLWLAGYAGVDFIEGGLK